MIRNHEILKDNFVCGKILAKYLQNHGVPLLSIESGKYYFRKTKALREALEKIPWSIKILERIL
jgi:hypothetical protein